MSINRTIRDYAIRIIKSEIIRALPIILIILIAHIIILIWAITPQIYLLFCKILPKNSNMSQ